MDLTPAPFHEDIAGGPAGGAAYWRTTSDGLRIRVGFWPAKDAKGTVLLFPGRTEYIEKYGTTAGEFTARGYATVVIDWRGQGLADRLIEDRRIGHVIKFTDYQKDVTAALEVVRALNVPEPLHLVGHSMGGGIGLRAALEGLPVQTCAFTGPMWGIYMAPLMRPFGYILPRVADIVGMGTRLPPSTRFESYVLANPFEGNMLTTDPEMFDLMKTQLEAQPELSLGGPSLIWLREALAECKYLARQPAPNLPCATFLGENEKIIDCASVRDRMASWSGGLLNVVPGAEHEILMEARPIRNRVFDQLERLFSGQMTVGSPAKSA
ncbi:alpha/beta hydrolase [Arenibacterium sp. CAU 1754]